MTKLCLGECTARTVQLLERGARYQLVRVEAEPTFSVRELTCVKWAPCRRERGDLPTSIFSQVDPGESILTNRGRSLLLAIWLALFLHASIRGLPVEATVRSCDQLLLKKEGPRWGAA